GESRVLGRPAACAVPTTNAEGGRCPPYKTTPAHLGSDSRDANRSAISPRVRFSSSPSGITEISEATWLSTSSLFSATLLASLSPTLIISPCVATRPVSCWPFTVVTVVERYWSLITFDGYRIDSRMSARLKRLATVVRSGPIPSPSLPYLWHLRHWAFSK